MRAALGASIVVTALASCATTRPLARRTDAASGPSAYEVHPSYVNLIPFGVGQLQNGEPGKGLAFAAAEGATLAISAGTWLYLSETYHRTIPLADLTRVQRLQRIEVGSGVLFLGLAAAGIIDSFAHYQPRVEIEGTAVTVGPAVVPGGAGLALSWSR